MNLYGACVDLIQTDLDPLSSNQVIKFHFGTLSVQLVKRILTGTESIDPASKLYLLLHYLLNDTFDAFSNFLGLVFYSAEAGNF